MKNVLKITAFSLFLVFGVALAAPQKAEALLLDFMFEDAPNGPHCAFMDCDSNRTPSVINNTVNSNNTNSFNNNTAPISGSINNQVGNDGRATIQTTPYATTPVYQTPSPSTNTNTNYNYNYNTGGGNTYVPTPVYYPQPTYYYHQPSVPVYYYQPTTYTTPYQYPVYRQPTYYYNQPVTYAPGIQVACAADKTSTGTGVPVTWSAEAVYNNSAVGFAYSWSGNEGPYGNGPTAIATYYSPGTKSAIVTVTAPNGQTQSKVCSNTVTVKSNTIAQAPKPSPTPTVTVTPIPTPTPTPEVTPASLFSLGNVPWGWVGILIILVLIGVILYLAFNRKKI